MCSRYTLTLNGENLLGLFEAEGIEDPSLPGWAPPRYNIAPTDNVPIYLESEKDGTVTPRLEVARWGLLFGGKRSGNPLINTRVESLEGGTALAGVFAKRRALVPADGYYEWQKVGNQKQPYYFHGDEPLAFAGLYQWAKAEDGSWLLSTSVITRPPTEAAAAIHERMPLVLPRSFWSDWVDPTTEGSRTLLDAALAASDEIANALHAYPVGRAVGNVTNEGQDLIAPLGA
ncbi:MAG TPA: SOS response-associated peptidase [Microbacteriaceae bacterium]|jgi:putative SOS response-associated peptidase YedK|nr:SOS response-associated peptidase [Microbacteriaceae bacterium]